MILIRDEEVLRLQVAVDNSLAMRCGESMGGLNGTTVYSRRHPEFWWGAAWLPQFWLAAAFGVGLICSLWRERGAMARTGADKE